MFITLCSVLYFLGSVQVLDAEATLICWQVCRDNHSIWIAGMYSPKDSKVPPGQKVTSAHGRFGWPKNSDQTLFLPFKLSTPLGNSDLQ